MSANWHVGQSKDLTLAQIRMNLLHILFGSNEISSSIVKNVRLQKQLVDV